MAFVEVFPVITRGPTTQGTPLRQQISGAKIPVNATKVTIRPKMTQTTRDNTSARLYIDIYKSFDDGATWQHDAGTGPWLLPDEVAPGVFSGWTGGTGKMSKDGLTLNPPPTITYEGQSLASIRDALIELRVEIPNAIPVGLEREIL